MIKNQTEWEINIILRLYIGWSNIVSISPKPDDNDIIMKDEHLDYYITVKDKFSFFDFIVVMSD